MGTEGSGKRPFDERLAEIESELGKADPWERPTQQRIRAIEQNVAPVSYPPAVGRRWTPAGVVLVLTAFGAMCVTAGGALGPLLVKPDLTGYVKEERLTACEARMVTKEEAHEKALSAARDQTAKCYDKLGDCKSQQGASEVVIDSLEKKRRR